MYGIWRWVIQGRGRAGDNLVQTLYQQQCTAYNQACDSSRNGHPTQFLREGLTSKCEQQYMTVKMVVLKDDGSTPEFDTFFLSSACSCRLGD